MHQLKPLINISTWKLENIKETLFNVKIPSTHKLYFIYNL